jgi:hypothetical protein
LSEIVPGTGDPQKPATDIAGPAEENKETFEPPKKKPLGFSIPKLNVTGLGLSEIVPGTGDQLPI